MNLFLLYFVSGDAKVTPYAKVTKNITVTQTLYLFFQLLFPPSFVPGDDDVNVERSVEGPADAEVQHAASKNKHGS
jgi:hypothetical protein